MLNLPAPIVAHADDDPYLAAHLIQIQGATTHYWTDYTSDLAFEGNTYTHSTPFSISQIVTDASGVQTVTLTFDEQLHQIQGIQNAEGLADRKVLIYEAWIDSTLRDVNGNKTTILAAQLCVSGLIDGSPDFNEETTASTATLVVSQSFVTLVTNGPRNHYNLSCANGYMDARCKYSGLLPDCDHSYDGSNGCIAHANTPNFRGCRHALAPGTTVLWGGDSTAATTLRTRTFFGLVIRY